MRWSYYNQKCVEDKGKPKVKNTKNKVKKEMFSVCTGKGKCPTF